MLKQLKKIGYDWSCYSIYIFLIRSVTVRQPQVISIERVIVSNKEKVQLFFNKMIDVTRKHYFVTVKRGQNPGTRIAEKAQKRVGSITIFERGEKFVQNILLGSPSQLTPTNATKSCIL